MPQKIAPHLLHQKQNGSSFRTDRITVSLLVSCKVDKVSTALNSDIKPINRSLVKNKKEKQAYLKHEENKNCSVLKTIFQGENMSPKLTQIVSIYFHDIRESALVWSNGFNVNVIVFVNL